MELTEELLSLCEEDAKEASMLAIQLKETIHQYSSKIQSLSSNLSIFSLPHSFLEPNLMMPLW